ncbi:MAG TPA: 1,4-alpha-glucan branching protein domain-containing protein [Solirubrobacteraceae bacterium]
MIANQRRSQDRGALAIVLHTHMPYVEGFGTWPFGEEWLWEAIASCYLPLLEVLDAGAPLTLSLTPVLCDQLEAPGVAARFEAFVNDVRQGTHERDAAGLRAGGEEALACELERAWGDYAGALEGLRRRDGDMLAALAPHAQWTSSATHAILPLLASDAGARMQIRSGVAAFRRRFEGRWRGGFWLPECAYAPWLERVLADAGVGAACVELTNGLGLGSAAHLRPLVSDAGVVLVPIDRATMSLVWSERGYPAAGAYRDYHHHTINHHNPWNNAGAPYDHAQALALAREHAADFVARTRVRLRDAGGTDRLVVCALDTELLGHWWYEGIAWLEAVVEECARQRLELVRLDDGLERLAPVAVADVLETDDRAGAGGAAPASSWGLHGDLSTWSAPAVAEIARATRAGEFALLRAGERAGRQAIRELLAMQASDWAFMTSRKIAVPYASERFAGHRRALARALEADAGDPGDDGALRNLAVDAERAWLLAP